jgi:membrane dipeptidase
LEGHDGLTPRGREYVERLDALKIFVDLPHISRKAFFDAVEAHDKSLPLIVTHTGIASVYEHWRNVTDEQLRVVADTGGTIGIMFERGFLGPRNVSSATVVDHVARVIEVVGEDFVSLGSDYDGAIVPPSDLPTVLELPRLVQEMLNRGWSDTRIRKVLGGNFLRAVALMRG